MTSEKGGIQLPTPGGFLNDREAVVYAEIAIQAFGERAFGIVCLFLLDGEDRHRLEGSDVRPLILLLPLQLYRI